MIEIQHLTKTFPTADGNFDALHDVSLKIEDGEIYGIIGMSGAGKSTLVRCINMLERPTEGKVIIDGRDMSTLTEYQLREQRRNITMIFQGFNLLMQRNCLRNVCFPLELAGVKKSEAVKRATELLEIVGLGDKLKSYPAQLSGGQQQRVAIARAMATSPEIIYFDEPTSALDPELTVDVLGAMRRLAEDGMTMLVVTHEMGFARNVADRVVFMEGGSVVAEAPSEEFFAHPANDRVRAFLRTVGAA